VLCQGMVTTSHMPVLDEKGMCSTKDYFGDHGDPLNFSLSWFTSTWISSSDSH